MKQMQYQRLVYCTALVLCLYLVQGAMADSYAHINQELGRPVGWQQIVEGDDFSLGEKVEIDTVGDLTLHEMAYGTYPSIDGSTVTVPMAMEFGRQHLSISDADLEHFVFFNRTHTAYVNLIDKLPNIAPQVFSEDAVMDEAHPVDIILVTSPSDEELLLSEECGVPIVQEPVCLDAFVFIVHKDNPIESLTVEQIQQIYGGEIVDFAEVGGERGAIAAYQRPKNSGSQTAMEDIVMQGKPLVAAKMEYQLEGMGQLVEAVGTFRPDAQSLGYTYLYYIDTLYKHDDIKVLSIDGIAPTPDNLRSGTYPFTTAYYGVIREEDAEAVGGKFLEWMLSEEGQKCIAQAGYVPVMAVE